MAKATAQITLHYVIDVKAVYRYYLLQASALTKPSKPTEYPPDSKWDDTEPAYTEGSTNSLYFVDCTVFGDDSFSYSEVSLSSSYEAAKQAYNKAANAQETADNLEKEMEENNTSIETKILETRTSIENNLNEVLLSALESYVKTGDYEEFKQQLTELYVTPEGLDIKISDITASQEAYNKDTDDKFNEFYKHFSFSENGLTIMTSSDSEQNLELQLDSGIIKFLKNGEQFGWWDGVDFHTGNIVVNVNERAQFGNFAFVPRTDGSLMFLKVGDS